MPTNIFCDEAGFTGNNLLDTAQPLFAYACVAIEPSAAQTLVDDMMLRFRPQGHELKGGRLVTSSPGRKVVTAVLEACADRSMVSVWNKRFALATQFFEHVFEPVLASQNSLFYGCGFHKFISNLIYIAVVSNTERAAETLGNFQRIVKARGGEPIERLFPAPANISADADILADIETFVLCHQGVIARSMDTRGNTDPIYRWSLDATLSALWSLLMVWSERLHGDPLIVTCDESKPIFDIRDRFDVMIGRTDRPVISYPSGLASPVFNLAEPLRFARSHESPGIQLADVVAAAAVHALANPAEQHSKRWLRLLKNSLHLIAPEPELIDLRTEHGAVNALVLKELVERSLRRENLFQHVPELIAIAKRDFSSFLERLPPED